MSFPRFILQAYLLTNTIALSISIAPSDDVSDALQSLAVGAAANTLSMPAAPHTDFDTQNVAAMPDQPDPTAEDSSRASIMRREAVPLSAHGLSRRILAEAASQEQELMGHSDSDESEAPHKFEEDPRFTPEAMFANKKLDPTIAEFLGHLAQRSRVHRKENHKAAQAAGLISEGRGRVASSQDEDDSDDIEDMKKSVSSTPKTTPLSHFFDHLDSKTSAGAWNANDCAAISQNITAKYAKLSGRSRATWASTGPATQGRSEIHTGMFFRHWKLSKDSMQQAARKLRLGVLSFLATQDAAKVRLHIWTDLDKNNNTIRDMLGPIAHHPEFMDAINITTFDPKIEFQKVPPTLARETLEERFKQDTMPGLRSDLYRSVILYNYGGLWMDADTVLMQDMAPLLGEDWAYLVNGKEGAVEGALLSASHPQSHFTNAYLISLVMREPPLFPELEHQIPLLAEIFDSDPAHSIMHVLPPCFMDGDKPFNAAETAVLSSDTSMGSDFFGKPVALPYREFFSIGIHDAVQDNSTAEVSVLQDPSFKQQDSELEDMDGPAPTSPSWAYHWRGNFAATWARGSLADVAERTFIKKLQLQKAHW